MSGYSECPGSRMVDLSKKDTPEDAGGRVASQLRQWPIQLHLVSPQAPYYNGADVLLAADCVPFAMGNFHTDALKGKALAIACPKLDGGQDFYLAKIKGWIDDAKISTLTVMIMQVPCCRGLLGTALAAARQARRKVPIRCVVLGLQGDVLQEEWVEA